MATFCYKVDKIKNLFECDVCLELLAEPVTLACGCTVCKSHLKDISEEERFECESCQEEHSVPKAGFRINKNLQKALNCKLNALKASPIFEECKLQIESVRKSLSKIDQMSDDPELFVYEYFENIKRQVDLRREELKFKIDEYSDEIVVEISRTQSNYQKSAPNVSPPRVDMELLKDELDQLVKKLDTVEINDSLFENVKEEILALREKCDRIPFYRQHSYIVDKDYSFTFRNITIDQDFFGSFSDLKRFGDSSILDVYLQAQLIDLCKCQNQKWDLNYRATRHGFSSQRFHSACNGISNTLTVVKATNGNIFGGFTTEPWNSQTTTFLNDSESFIFSLVNKHYKPFTAKVLNGGKNAIRCSGNHGPVFGNGDLLIATDSNDSQNSSSTLGNSYRLPKCLKDKSILAGTTNFKTIDIEVFSKA